MNDLYKEFGTNKELEQGGVKVSPIDGIYFWVKRTGGANKAYSEAATKRLRPYVQKFNNGKSIPLDIVQNINIELFVEYALTNWENVTDRQGNPLPFNKENATKLLQELPELYSFLSDSGSDLSLFQNSEVEEISKKSSNA